MTDPKVLLLPIQSAGASSHRLRVLLTVVSLALIGLIVYLQHRSTGSIGALSLLVTIVGASFLFRRTYSGPSLFRRRRFLSSETEQDREREDETVFLLTGAEFVRSRPGSPDARIALSDIASVDEDSDRLIIQGKDPLTRISVPYRIAGYSQLRQELAKQYPIKSTPRRASMKMVRWALVGSILALPLGGALAALTRELDLIWTGVIAAVALLAGAAIMAVRARWEA
jgi:hypothetical protein